MSTTVNRQPANVPLVDPKTGLITREWYRFFIDTFTRIGGQTAPTNTDLSNLIAQGVAGEMTMQQATQSAVSEQTMQPTQAGDSFADVMQSQGCDCVQDMILQG